MFKDIFVYTRTAQDEHTEQNETEADWEKKGISRRNTKQYFHYLFFNILKLRWYAYRAPTAQSISETKQG